MEIFDFLVKITIFKAFLLFWGDLHHGLRRNRTLDPDRNAWCESLKKNKKYPKMAVLMAFNPISHELWNDVITRGGAIMARMDSSHPEAVSRHSRAQNWLPSNSFDLWLSIDTKNSTLWTVVLAMLAVEGQWQKLKFYMQK